MQAVVETPVRGAIRRKPAAEPVYVKDDLTDRIEFELLALGWLIESAKPSRQRKIRRLK
jgi:hypothetical protein